MDGPLRSTQRGLGEPFEIKVYEIDDVERLQRRRGGGSKEVTGFNAKLKILEHRQQRIAEVRAKYEWLMKELEVTKQYLMLDPNKWLSECKAPGSSPSPGPRRWGEAYAAGAGL